MNTTTADASRVTHEKEAGDCSIRRALELAEGRLSLLMNAELPDTDHPTATGYVLKQVRDALETISARNMVGLYANCAVFSRR